MVVGLITEIEATVVEVVESGSMMTTELSQQPWQLQLVWEPYYCL